MNTTDVAIIGGSAAGLAAATTLMRRYPEKRISLIRNVTQTVVPCGIPYVYGTLGAVNKNIVPDNQFRDAGVNIITKHVNVIDRDNKVVEFDDGETLGYDKLILSTGSKPFLPPIDGVDLTNVFCIHKDPAHLQTILDALNPAQNVVVIGGGFIGVEMAEQIARMESRPAHIRLVEMLPHCLMTACEEEYCVVAEKELEREGVEVMTNCQVKAIHGDSGVRTVELADGRQLDADVVVIGIGAAPNIELAERSGIACDARGGVKVSRTLQTSDPAIYAAGDCAEKFSFFNGEPSAIRLASIAASEGTIAASNLYADTQRETLGALGAFATKVGTRSIAAAGVTTQAAKQQKLDVVIGEAVASNMHPGSLPNAIADMRVKLIFERQTGRLLGGHVCGGDSSAELANAIAVAVQAQLTANDLSLMQYATHPLLTASPVMYQLMVAAENALIQL
ncbi:FAD-dependent oxidoreductase [uncultured Desulfuromonas sp.]|uniref:FAD-dependent oxidoreductase n=1 Tax=uncultured Desulfuromonas sp. TaxID=181013 RepID=UPI002AAA8B7A|nr:FAD-dependent oxidoreductase [uncultured Desulfuromonas sp.]